MKKSILKYIAFFIFLTIFTNCTVKDITVDPATGEKKSLILISPDYLKTTIQVRLRDADTKAFLKNEMVVKVYSNKKVIDFGGYYKNEFTVKNGILNFAIDPNEDISTASPLILRVMSSTPGVFNVNSAYMPAITTLTMTSPSSKVLLIQQNKPTVSSTQASSGIKAFAFNTFPPYYLTVDGKFAENTSIGDMDFSPLNRIKEPNLYVAEYWPLSPSIQTSTHKYKINFTRNIDPNLTDYRVIFDYWIMQYIVYKSGKTITKSFFTKENVSKIEGFNGDIARSKEENNFATLNVKVYTNDVGTCPSGYTFGFSGLGGNGTELEYELSRKNDNGESFPTNSGILKLNGIKSATPTDVTEQDITFGKLSNTVTFSPNSQYTVEPQKLDLGDSSSCGKTFNFKLTPKVLLTKYKLILKAGCSGKSISILPNLIALYNAQASGLGELSKPRQEGVEFIAGSTTLYLTPNGKYSFQGEYNGKNFNFDLTTDLNNLESMRTRTLAANPDIKNISYTQGTTGDKKGNAFMAININLTFSEKSCPF